MTEAIAVNPEICKDTLDKGTGFPRWDAFDKEQRVVLVFRRSTPFVQVARAAVIRGGSEEQIAFDSREL